eukprot:294452-Pyramimonas_sp.AAC.1
MANVSTDPVSWAPAPRRAGAVAAAQAGAVAAAQAGGALRGPLHRPGVGDGRPRGARHEHAHRQRGHLAAGAAGVAGGAARAGGAHQERRLGELPRVAHPQLAQRGARHRGARPGRQGGD